MTREEFVRKFHWNKVMWVIGFVNIIALIPQPVQIALTHSSKDVSIWMFILFFFVQVTFTIEFFLKKSWGAMFSLGTSGVLSLITIALALRYR
ncbi:MAG: PQ-loop domain-containing transporter [Minisyncoccia bacterium]